MERSFGADALLNESWATPWLDEGVFPYWPQAVRFGDLEDFLRWLVVHDSRRAALVLNHAREFEKVHHLVTTELSRPKHQEHEQPYHPGGGQAPQPLASSTAAALGTRGGTVVRGPPPAQALAAYSGGGEGRRRGPGGGGNKTSSPPFRTASGKDTNAYLDDLSSSRGSSDARRSKRLSASSGSSSGGGGGGGGRGDRVRAATSVMPADGSNPWPLPPNLLSASGNGPHDVRYSRHKTVSIIRPPAVLRASSRRGTPALRGRTAVQQPTSVPLTSSATAAAAAAMVGAYGRSDAPVAPNNPRRTTTQWGSLGVGAGGPSAEKSGGSSRSSTSSGGGNGSSNGRCSSSGSGGGSSNSSSGRRGSKATGRRVHGPGGTDGAESCPGFSSWAAMAAAVVAAEAAERTAAVRQAVEEAAADAEAEGNYAAIGRGKRGRGILSPEKHSSGSLTRRLSRRSPPSTMAAWEHKSNDNDLKRGGVAPIHRYLRKDIPANLGISTADSDLGLSERPLPPHAAEVTPRGNSNEFREATGHPSPSEHQHQVQFIRSPPSLLQGIDETKEEEEEEEEEGDDDDDDDKQEGDGQSWICMRDPVSLREFWFDPETRAAEWEGGGAMEDSPGGMGLGLLSQEDRERLRGKFERRQRRARRASGVVGGGRGTPSGTAGLREKVLRKLTLDGDIGGGGSGGGDRRGGADVAAKAAPVQRGAATRGVFFS